MDDVARINTQHWERMVREGNGYTQPWLDLDPEAVRRYAGGELDPAPDPLAQIYPADLLTDVQGRDVLCLASGGGQQSAVFGLLGARVTVVDFAAGQLVGDRLAAAHYGYAITALLTDMRDLSALGAETFDLVYQPPSLSYVPDVRPVFAEVSRVLRPGGRYAVALTNPAVQFVDADAWDGQGYRITTPYAVRRHDAAEQGRIDFRHYWYEISDGLLAHGLSIERLVDDPAHLRPAPDASPGSWEHLLAHVPWLLTIVARKGCRAGATK